MKVIFQLGSSLLLIFVLAGCQSTAPYPDKTGDLGEEAPHRPGDVYVKLAAAYLKQGQTATALQKIKRGLEVDPQNANAQSVIALIYVKLEEFDLASQHYHRALQLAPQDPFILNSYGSFLCEQKQFDAALQQFDLAVANPLYPTPMIALTNAGSCARGKGDLVLAERYLQRALRYDQAFGPALLRMAELRFDQGDFINAGSYLTRYDEAAEPTPDSLWLAVQLEWQAGDFLKAAYYERQLRSRFPNAPQVQSLQEAKR